MSQSTIRNIAYPSSAESSQIIDLSIFRQRFRGPFRSVGLLIIIESFGILSLVWHMTVCYSSCVFVHYDNYFYFYDHKWLEVLAINWNCNESHKKDKWGKLFFSIFTQTLETHSGHCFFFILHPRWCLDINLWVCYFLFSHLCVLKFVYSSWILLDLLCFFSRIESADFDFLNHQTWKLDVA